MAKKFTEKLQDACEEWMIRTKPVRKCRQQMLEVYANGYYDGGSIQSHRPLPLNIIDRGVQIIAPFLVTNNPRVTISVRYGVSKPGLKSYAITLELALANLFDEINLSQKTLRPIIIDSLFAMGITKTGIWSKDEVDVGDYRAMVGQEYCDRVDFNDYIGDVAARNREEMMIEGNRYRLPRKFVTDSGLFKNFDFVVPDVRQEKETDPKQIVERGENEYTDLRETVELQDIWIPDEGIIITLPMRGQGTKIIREVEWDGPEGGPYDVLYYKNFPDSILPIPPVYTWLDISKTINAMARKMSENVEREKSLGVYQLGDDVDAEKTKDAKHGDLIGLQNPESIKEVTIGGFEPKSMEYLQYLEHQFAISYSNLYGIGGRGTQANTLGQEQMLQYNATRALDDMIEQFHSFTRSIVKKLAWFMWNNPMRQTTALRNVAGMDLEVKYSEATKKGEFPDYVLDIDPYSLSRMNPELRFQKMMQLITAVIMPLAPLAAQQGSYPDVDEIVKDVGHYLNIPNLESWWKSAVPPTDMSQGAPMAQSGSPGQGNDQFGADLSSRLANLQQQQSSMRGGQPSPPNAPKQ